MAKAKRSGCFSARGCLLRLAVLGALAAVALGGLAVASGLGSWLAYEHYIVRNPGAKFEPAAVRAIVAQESPVTYRDGQTPLGVFFEGEHRAHVGWDEIPMAWKAAIVASEDGDYWSHAGISPKHLTRAMLGNLVAGGVTSGGSTLTQQTAKNLFYRPDRSIKSKLVELVDALKLEAHFDKQEILTFYANQFHVAGNGRGIGIAARHFFSKEAADLTLLESAYLAGAVKGPSNYDPFASDPDRRARNLERAHERTRYVLRRIAEEDPDKLAGGDPATRPERLAQITALQADAQKLLDADFTLAFQKGTFRYDSNAVLDEVARRLQEPPFADVLTAAGITDPDTAGLVVVTTLDEDAQREAIYGLWHHLTEAGTMLEGLGPDDYVLEDAKVAHDPNRVLVPHEFRLGEVSAHAGDNGRKYLELDLGGPKCTADRDAVTRVALAAYRGERKSKSAKVSSTWIDQFVAQLPVGAVLLVSVREVGDKGAFCDLEVRPQLQGSVVVVEDGQIRAMVAGNDNRNLNRAAALRQMGSTWKPLLFHAAMELGWSPLDTLDNRPGVFPFQGVYYWPGADHAPAPEVSMAWAGVNSENLASVWLLYHLTDALPFERVAQLAETLELARGADESEQAYRDRLRKLGIVPTQGRLAEARFLQARAEVLRRLPESGHPEDELALRSLHYGWGFADERKRVARDPAKLAALDFSWVELQERGFSCTGQYRRLASSLQLGVLPPPGATPDLSVRREDDVLKVACGAAPEGYERPTASNLAFLVVDDEPEPEDTVFDREPEPEPEPDRGGRRRGGKDKRPPARPAPKPTSPPRAPWSTAVATWGEGPRLAAESDVLVDGRLHLSTVIALETALAQSQAPITDLYAPEALYWHPDFRVLLGIRYMAELGRQYGIRSDLREVLPLTLGASEITLEEATAVYDGITTGAAWDFPGEASGQAVDAPPAPALLIAEIRDVDGNVLYRANPTERRVATPEAGAMTADILANVVRHGTGRRAYDAIVVGGGRVPLGGKTGTTNDFRNAAFLGFAPKAAGSAYDVPSGYAVGVYVGYDDNRPMESGSIALAGSSGALPAWTLTVRGLHTHGLLGVPAGRATEAQWALSEPQGLARVAVQAGTGLVSDGAVASLSVLAFPQERPAPAPVEIAIRRRPTVRRSTVQRGDGQSVWSR